jgi:hypothetical protein
VQSFVAKFKDEFVAKGEADEKKRAEASQGATGVNLKIAASPHS